MTDQRIDSSGYDQIISLDHNKTQTEVVKFRIRSNARRADIERRSQMSQSADIGYAVVMDQLHADFQILYPNLLAKVSKGLLVSEAVAWANQSAASELARQIGLTPEQWQSTLTSFTQSTQKDVALKEKTYAWFYHKMTHNDVKEGFPLSFTSMAHSTSMDLPLVLAVEEFEEQQWDAGRTAAGLSDQGTSMGRQMELEGLRQLVSNIRDQGIAWGQSKMIKGLASRRAIASLIEQRAPNETQQLRWKQQFDELLVRHFQSHLSNSSLRDQVLQECQQMQKGIGPQPFEVSPPSLEAWREKKDAPAPASSPAPKR